MMFTNEELLVIRDKLTLAKRDTNGVGTRYLTLLIGKIDERIREQATQRKAA